MRLHVRPPQSTPEHRRTLRELVRAGCENRPGTYRMLSQNGTVVYVGQSRVLRTRLLSYFRAKGHRNKAARILRHAFHIQWEYAPTEFGALLRELRLIKLHRPHFNSQMVTDEMPRGYLALTGGAVPGLRVVDRSDFRGADVMYGPFRKVSALRDAARALADVTGMRDCTIDDVERGNARRALWFADATAVPRRSRSARAMRNTLRVAETPDATMSYVRSPAYQRVAGCLRHELGTCSGPCVGHGEAAAYARSVAEARAFLEGGSTAVLDRAASAMREAAAQLQFERAGALRDRLLRLTWLSDRLRQFHANVDRLTFRYHAVGHDGAEHVYLVRRGTVRAERALPVAADECAAWEAEARQVFGAIDANGAEIPLHDLDEFHLIASWFRRRPGEVARTRRP